MTRRNPGQLELFTTASDPSIRVLAHQDPHVLEQELLDRVESHLGERSSTPVLVLVPTTVLARHVQRRLTERRSAWLGVEVRTFRGLVHQIVETRPDLRLRALSKRLLESLLRRELERSPSGRLRSFIDRRPGGIRSLLASLNDLREAGVPPGATVAAAASGTEKELAGIHARYVAALDALAERGLTDEAGLVGAASDLAERFAGRYAGALVHGVYELVGMHLDLVRALARGTALTALLPFGPGAPAGRYGENYARRHLLASGSDPSVPAGGRGGLLGSRIEALFDEGADLEPLADGAVRLRHTQGPDAELTVALRHAMKAVEQGAPPPEIALVARSLSPYAAAIGRNTVERREELEDPGAKDLGRVPCTTSLTRPLRRQPVVHDLLVLLRLFVEDFPRALTVELLRSPRVRWESLVPGPPMPRGDLANAFSRAAGILGGIREWTEDLTDWAASGAAREDAGDEERERSERMWERRREHAGRIAGALRSLEARFGRWPACGWERHAERIDKLRQTLLITGPSGEDARAVESLEELLREMRLLAVVTGEAEVSLQEALSWLERAVDETELHPDDRAESSIRVLDMMQVRGMTFRRVFLLGMHASLFPRRPREDPFLGDELRRRLAERTGRPLPVKLDGEHEERLLLSMILGAARERLDVSWQRADDTGRAATPSLTLREIARVVHGRPDMHYVKGAAERISSHPRRRLEDLGDSPGLLSARDELLMVSLRSPNPESARRMLVERAPDLGAGLRMICATEPFAPVDPAFDGRISGRTRASRSFAATTLEQLGRCPLRYFFSRVLRVRELDEEATAHDVPYREMGRAVHRVLETLYRQLGEEGLFGAGDGERLLARANELLDDVWRAEMAGLERRRAERLRLLWSLTGQVWKRALRRFLAKDLRRIVEQDWDVSDLELVASRPFELENGEEVEIRGRLDRRLSKGAASWVGDYKTSGRLESLVNRAEMLRGARLQVPLYHWIVEGEARVSLLGVGPYYDLESETPDYANEKDFDGFDDRKRLEERGFHETLRVLLALERSGVFPLVSSHGCSNCEFRIACRENHPPTVERESNTSDAVDFHDVLRKTRSAPLLALVRASGNRR